MKQFRSSLLPAAFLIVAVMAGLVLMGSISLTGLDDVNNVSLIHYRSVITQPAFWTNAVFSLYLAVVASFLAMVAGTITAYGITTSKASYLRRLTERVMQTGLVLPYLYAVFLSFLLMGQTGLLSRLALKAGLISSQSSFPVLIFDTAGIGMIWVYVFKGIPFVTLMTLTVMVRVNRQYRAVAQTLGAGGFQQFLRIYLPLSRRVILWSCLVLYSYTLGSFEVPHLISAFQPRPLSASLYSLYLRPGVSGFPQAMAMGIVLLAISSVTAVIYLWVLNWLLKNSLHYRGRGFSINSRFASLWFMVLSGLWVIPMVYIILFSFFASYPYPNVIPGNFSLQYWDNTLMKNNLFFPGLFTSVQLAILTGVITSLVGVMAAHGLSRMKHNLSVSWFALISLPLFVPAMVLMIGLHLVMLRFSLANTKAAVLAAHVIISLPYATAILTAYAKGIGTGMEEAANTLGSNTLHYYRKVVLPLMMPGLFLSFCIGFLVSFSELFSVLLLGGGNVLTFSMLMYPAITNSQWGNGAVMGTLFLLIHAGLFFLADRWTRRSFSGTDYLY